MRLSWLYVHIDWRGLLASIPKFEAAKYKAGHGRMRTESTVRKLFFVFSLWVFSVLRREQIGALSSAYNPTLSEGFHCRHQSNIGIQV
jgi:hypothetical protein